MRTQLDLRRSSAGSVRAVTYSIVARDPTTGALGIAAQSHWLAVGATVTWAQAGVGVVATQSYTDPAYGPTGLALLRVGRSPHDALEALIGADTHRERRQVALVDAGGEVAVHTGDECIPAAGHRIADGVGAQANMMSEVGVWDRMVDAYHAQPEEPLAERLVAALRGAEAAGGDIRGAQSAALLVVDPEWGQDWPDTAVNLRVDDHPAPTTELARLLQLHRAYEHLYRGRNALEQGDHDAASAAYTAASHLAPENEEIAFWRAVALARAGGLDGAADLLGPVLVREPAWRELLLRLPAAGLLGAELASDLVARLE